MISLLLALIIATPANANGQIGAARCGDSVAMVGAFTAKVSIAGKPTCIVPIDASQATINWLWFNNAQNYAVSGGDFTGAPYAAVQISGGAELSIAGATLEHFGTAGISMQGASHVTVTGNSFQHSGGDAIDVISSQFVDIEHNRVADLTYTAALHSDNVQMWNVAGLPPVSDVMIAHNTGDCHCQGYDNFGGLGTPMARISIIDNQVAIDTQWAASLNACADCVISGNTAYTLMGMPHGWVAPNWFMAGAPVAGNIAGMAP